MRLGHSFSPKGSRSSCTTWLLKRLRETGAWTLTGYTLRDCCHGKEKLSQQQWWGTRSEGRQAWRVSAEEILANGANLDLANPNATDDLERLPATELVKRALMAERALIEILEDVQKQLASEGA